jgi:sporulation protein YlmC with PRC-barrel domain
VTVFTGDHEEGMGAQPATNGGKPRDSATSVQEIEEAQYLRVSDLVDRKVVTEASVTIGKLEDFVFVDDPKYAEVTHLLVRRPFGRPPLKVPWSRVVRLDRSETVVKDPPPGAPPYE